MTKELLNWDETFDTNLMVFNDCFPDFITKQGYPTLIKQFIQSLLDKQKEEIRKEIEKRKAPKGQLFLQEKNVYRNKIIDDILNLKCLN